MTGSRTEMAEAPEWHLARRLPVQQRSRERFERILACAVELMAEKGSDALKMSDIVERSGVPFGSLYQYFPDKTAVIATLAERYNAMGHACVRETLGGLSDLAALHGVLCDIADSYYRFFQTEPAVHLIWQATQADRALQVLDAEDGAYLSGMLLNALWPLAPHVDEEALAGWCGLVMVQIAAAVRYAVTLPPAEAAHGLAMFKAMLPRDLSALAPG